MVLSLGFIVGFIGVAVALLIGILLFSEVSDVVQQTKQEKLDGLDNMLLTVIVILPITLVFVIFRILGVGEEIDFRISFRNGFRKSKRILLEFLCLIGLANKIKVDK